MKNDDSPSLFGASSLPNGGAFGGQGFHAFGRHDLQGADQRPERTKHERCVCEGEEDVQKCWVSWWFYGDLMGITVVLWWCFMVVFHDGFLWWFFMVV